MSLAKIASERWHFSCEVNLAVCRQRNTWNCFRFTTWHWQRRKHCRMYSWDYRLCLTLTIIFTSGGTTPTPAQTSMGWPSVVVSIDWLMTKFVKRSLHKNMLVLCCNPWRPIIEQSEWILS
jgi:hypothetical protein